MNDESNVHQGRDESDRSLFHPNSETLGKELEFDDDYFNDLRWKVPAYFQTVSMAVRGDIMYHVHTILGNIVVDKEETKAIHGSALSVLESEYAKRYLLEQLKIAKRVLH